MQTMKPVPPVEGGAEAVATNGMIYSAGGYDSVALGDLPGEDFLQAIIQSACKSTL
jgi:hypothetical protein